MSAQRIGIFTIAFPDPYAIDYDNNKFDTLNDTLGFSYRILSNIQTLSTKGVDAGTDPYGILYVPDLRTDGCKEQERQHVPDNATRLSNLPDGKNYALIAVAPWYSAQCTIEYFTAARETTTKAFFTYQPGFTNAKPPVLNDASWNLQDGGSWQTANSFPTYAVSSNTGSNIMHQLEQYSGNVSNVPHGDELSRIYAPSEYVRLWASVGTDTGAQLPSLWVFLVIVLAILILAVSVTSLTMHILQRRRRNSLRQRVIAGEVDLEQLGVKRLTVSQTLLDKFPVYTYTAASMGVVDDPEKSPQQPSMPTLNAPPPVVVAGPGHNISNFRHSSAPTATPSALSSTSWSQPTCPICLDDFESGETQVRELPCKHIFHPDCIDTFLLNNSSLCPMCKQSALPKGDCPVKITNGMVRRERHINQMRVRAANGQANAVVPSVTSTGPPAAHDQPTDASPSLGSRIGGAITGRRIFSAPERTTRPSDIEMAHTTDHTVNSTSQPPIQPTAIPSPPSERPITQDCTPTQNRREWARQRALAMLGTRHAAVATGDVDEEDSSPRWRRGLRKVFPGFR
ncbi:hypothetical protein T440DRAFT_457389 [Plenodomus tracheiphilus IPT5]|uniref:RING-type domain-containing protein n=1 Tax=Plenodomus tracheiphilus IPT5 TaxID=1408161 RepID=A0A6A7AUD6_9PLEO|nr:hypothetical protein T440DRAFT_457389 [Plenodomus tracheiphilus IPT5]